MSILNKTIEKYSKMMVSMTRSTMKILMGSTSMSTVKILMVSTSMSTREILMAYCGRIRTRTHTVLVPNLDSATIIRKVRVTRPHHRI